MRLWWWIILLDWFLQLCCITDVFGLYCDWHKCQHFNLVPEAFNMWSEVSDMLYNARYNSKTYWRAISYIIDLLVCMFAHWFHSQGFLVVFFKTLLAKTKVAGINPNHHLNVSTYDWKLYPENPCKRDYPKRFFQWNIKKSSLLKL